MLSQSSTARIPSHCRRSVDTGRAVPPATRRLAACAIPVIATVLVAGGCGGRGPETGAAIATDLGEGGAVVYRVSEIFAESATCQNDPERCARVEIRTLATDRGGTAAVRENVNLFLNHDLVSRLRSHLPDAVGERTVDPEELAAAFLAEHRAFVAEFPDSPAGWTIEITTESPYNTESVTTLDISEIAYTGGAHPNSRRRLVSFDVATGRLLGLDDLTVDPATLIDRVEQRFRKEHGLDPDADLSEAGFWFPEGEFYLPDNFGIVADGIAFHWDQYEIAPYAAGPIDVSVSSGELAGVVDLGSW